MERHAGKKVVNPQWQPFELLRRDLWHRASESGPAGARATETPSRGPAAPLADRDSYEVAPTARAS
jgi:hypothetical protein